MWGIYFLGWDSTFGVNSGLRQSKKGSADAKSTNEPSTEYAEQIMKGVQTKVTSLRYRITTRRF